MEKNRISAAQSRQKKKEYISNLQNGQNRLTQENAALQLQLSKVTTQNFEYRILLERKDKEILQLLSDNSEMRARLKDLGAPVDERPRSAEIHTPVQQLFQTNDIQDLEQQRQDDKF